MISRTGYRQGGVERMEEEEERVGRRRTWRSSGCCCWLWMDGVVVKEATAEE